MISETRIRPDSSNNNTTPKQKSETKPKSPAAIHILDCHFTPGWAEADPFWTVKLKGLDGIIGIGATVEEAYDQLITKLSIVLEASTKIKDIVNDTVSKLR